MLEKAKAKGVYDELFQGDLVSFLAGCVDRYDAVVGAATLIHFGDLEALFQAVFRSLCARGLFVFTVFPHEGAASDYAVAANHALACSGCFGHSAAYVERLAREAGFSVTQMETAVHEHDQDGNPVAGMLVVLQRA
jgi:predicted TPR repeat methyltransferase